MPLEDDLVGSDMPAHVDDYFLPDNGYRGPSELVLFPPDTTTSDMCYAQVPNVLAPSNPLLDRCGPAVGVREGSKFKYEWTRTLRWALMAPRLTESGVALITKCLCRLEKPPSWYLNPRLFFVLHKMNRLERFSEILETGVTDLWLPIRKRILLKWLDDADTISFLTCQEKVFDETLPVDLQGRHFTLDSFDQLELPRVRVLGAGAFGEVHQVQNQRNGQMYACKTMARPVRYDAHISLMHNFKREVMGMRRVRHHHCVDLVASCTDMDSVTILSSPVADLDLSEFLNLDLDASQLRLLTEAIGCITSALAYLHSLNIRHDDLKPNNILIHGTTNILLTDFGFCLDSSDSGISTTEGPPSHSTRRYSAPEVFDHEPRSRLTDIWSLGCVLADIASRILGYKLDDLKIYWLSYGSKFDSYAENRVATTSWHSWLLQSTTDRSWLSILDLIWGELLHRDRLQRPSAEQVLTDLRIMQSPFHEALWVGACCRESQGTDLLEHVPRLVPSDVQPDGENDSFIRSALVNQRSDIHNKFALEDQRAQARVGFYCTEAGCKRPNRHFSTGRDLDRHRASVHGLDLKELQRIRREESLAHYGTSNNAHGIGT